MMQYWLCLLRSLLIVYPTSGLSVPKYLYIATLTMRYALQRYSVTVKFTAMP